MKRIYLDCASITPVDKRVLRVVRKYSGNEYANPSSWYKEGVDARKVLDQSRKTVASFIHAHADEVVFTSGGTEANSLAIIGYIEALHKKGMKYEDMHVMCSEIEHSSVRECFDVLKNKGVACNIITVSQKGVVDIEDLKSKLNSKTVLVSVMLVNNETGAIQPIKQIAKTLRHFAKTSGHNMLVLHSDASQSAYVEINVENMGLDMLTLDASKVYGPRGVGCLYVRRGVEISPIVYGGGQEGGLRSGTENLPGIAGFARAIDIAGKEREKEFARLSGLKKYFIDSLKAIRADIYLNGNIDTSSPHIANISIPSIDNEFFVMQLDAKGIAVSTKSSCLRDESESYVLSAMGANGNNSVRFSFGRWTGKGDVSKVLKVVKNILAN